MLETYYMWYQNKVRINSENVINILKIRDRFGNIDVYVTDDGSPTPKSNAEIPALYYLFRSKCLGFPEIIRDYRRSLRSLEKPKNPGQLTQESHPGVPKLEIKKK